MNTNKLFWSYLAQFSLEWEMFQEKKGSEENQNTHLIFGKLFFRKTCH